MLALRIARRTDLMPVGAAALCAVLCILATSALADDRVQRWPKWQQCRVVLDKCLVRDEFRIYYALSDNDALLSLDRGDCNGNGVPDKIENIARQLVAARRVFVEVMGLRHPFEGSRYKGRVKFIDVHVRGLKVNGSAGDAIVNYHRPSDPPQGVEVLTIDISKKLPCRNLTPAHELFHIFQNGYTLFKNAWYYEGMARWSESALGKGAGIAGPLPTSAVDVTELFKLKYGASCFWLAAARETDKLGRIRLPEALRALKYVGTETSVIGDDLFCGTALMRALLEELDRADEIVSRKRGLAALDWKEVEQRSSANDRHIWAATMNVCRRFQAASPALACMTEQLMEAPDDG